MILSFFSGTEILIRIISPLLNYYTLFTQSQYHGTIFLKGGIEMTNDEARQYFKDKGLSYQDVTIDDIRVLQIMLVASITESIKTDNKVNATTELKARLKNSKFTETGKVRQCFIRVKSNYYFDRECVSFNPDGFIGFGGWADEHHLTPFRNAFIKWCDYLAKTKKED
jgi:hypothetical protein